MHIAPGRPIVNEFFVISATSEKKPALIIFRAKDVKRVFEIVYCSGLIDPILQVRYCIQRSSCAKLNYVFFDQPE